MPRSGVSSGYQTRFRRYQLWSELPDGKPSYKNLNQMGSGRISLEDGIYDPTHYMGSMINDMEGGSDMRGL